MKEIIAMFINAKDEIVCLVSNLFEISKVIGSCAIASPIVLGIIIFNILCRKKAR